jgi:hypothetical protein
MPELSDVARSLLLKLHDIATAGPYATLFDAPFLRGGRPKLAGRELVDAGLGFLHPSGRVLLTPEGVRLARTMKGETVKPIDLQEINPTSTRW